MLSVCVCVCVCVCVIQLHRMARLQHAHWSSSMSFSLLSRSYSCLHVKSLHYMFLSRHWSVCFPALILGEKQNLLITTDASSLIGTNADTWQWVVINEALKRSGCSDEGQELLHFVSFYLYCVWFTGFMCRLLFRPTTPRSFSLKSSWNVNFTPSCSHITHCLYCTELKYKELFLTFTIFPPNKMMWSGHHEKDALFTLR